MKQGGEVSGVNRVQYTPPDPGWEAKEAMLLEDMRRRDEQRQQLPPEEEPPGIDAFLLVKPPESALALIGDSRVPLASADVQQTQTGTRIRRGFDLVRVGNFAEDPNALQVCQLCADWWLDAIHDVLN